MNLEDIRPNLLGIVQPIALFAAPEVQAALLIDDGQQHAVMESALKAIGFTLLIMAPEGLSSSPEAEKGLESIDYSTTLWLRTNPHVVAQNGKAVWDPLVCESAIIKAVMVWSRPRPSLQVFHLTKGAEPATDYMDTGNFSRLVRFQTRVVFQ